MEIENIDTFINNYYIFLENLRKKLKNPSLDKKYQECYLIDGNWFDNILSDFNKYKKDKKNKSNYHFKIEKKNVIQRILDSFNYNNKFIIVNNKLFGKNDKIFNDNNIFYFYIGYNKLIIEEPKIDSYLLQFSNPLDENINKRNSILIQITKKDKNKILDKYLNKSFFHDKEKNYNFKYIKKNEIEELNKVKLKLKNNNQKEIRKFKNIYISFIFKNLKITNEVNLFIYQLNKKNEINVLKNNMQKKLDEKDIELKNKNEEIKKKLKEKIIELENQKKEYEKILEEKNIELEKQRVNYKNILNKKDIYLENLKKENKQLKKENDFSKSNLSESNSLIKDINIEKEEKNNSDKIIKQKYSILEEEKEEIDNRLKYNSINEEKSCGFIDKNFGITKISKKEKINKDKSDRKGNIELIKEPILSYKNPTLIGLNDIGAAYFMNSILQCFSQTEKLTNFFLKETNINKIKSVNKVRNNEESPPLQLSCLYIELIQNLWKKKNNKNYSYAPYPLKDFIEKKKPNFKQGQEGDLKDFINFFLGLLHEELKKLIISNNNINKMENFNQYDKFDKNKTINNFLDEYKKNETIISNMFFGIKQITNVCLNCKKIYVSQNSEYPKIFDNEIFKCLIFPLEQIRNNLKIFKNNSDSYRIFNSDGIITLFDCFKYNEEINIKKFCPICQKECDFITTSEIYKCPEVLILILDRGKDYLNEIKLNFNENIDITEFVLKKDMPKINYSLYGVISLVENDSILKFVASCKNPVDKNWYKYNDSEVTNISNFQEGILNYGIPYMLFYEKEKYYTNLK